MINLPMKPSILHEIDNKKKYLLKLQLDFVKTLALFACYILLKS